MICLATLIFALLVDAILGEPKKYHPLIAFGYLAQKLEKKLNTGSAQKRFILGAVAWSLLVLPIISIYYLFLFIFPFYIMVLINVYVVYWALALNSLNQHGMQIYHPLVDGDINKAREYCAYIVSRDTRALDSQQISRATTESMLENGHDAVTATLIYFVLGGAPLVIMHRLANTLDAMWGYRTEQFNYFGKFSAWADDILGFVSAKITCLLFMVIALFKGKARRCFINAYQQSKRYKSHNGGWVMAAGATVIHVSLGGSANYFGKTVNSPILGEGDSVQAKHIKTSLILIKQAVLLWLVVVFILEILHR